MLLRILTPIVCMFSIPVFAAEEVAVRETCQLEGRIELDKPSQIVCLEDLKVAEGTKIITNGFELQVWILGNVDFAPATQGLHVNAFEEGKVYEQSAELPTALGTIAIHARSATGFLHIDNRGLHPEHAGGDISLAFGTTDNYEQELLPGRAGAATLIRNGESVALNGPLFRPIP